MAFTFDGVNKRITVTGVTAVSVQELYSSWKEWATTDNNLQYLQAMRTFGGDPTIEGQTAPAYYFMMNGWRVIVDGIDATFSYNLYTDEGENPIITLNGATARLNNSDVGIAESSIDKALEYGGYIVLSLANGTAGIAHPTGTYAQPVSNITDALALCSEYGFHQILIQDGEIILASGVDASGITFKGRTETKVTVQTGAILTHTEFRSIEVEGDFGGYYVDLFRCEVEGDIINFNGHMTSCAIGADISISEHATATINDCSSYIPGLGRPTITASGQGCSLNLRSYSGGLTVGGFAHTNCNASLEFVAGKCELLPTCTGGTISVRGVAHLTDSSNGATVDTSALVGNLVSVDASQLSVTIDNDAVATAVDTRLNPKLVKLNTGIKRASKLIPYNEDLT